MIIEADPAILHTRIVAAKLSNRELCRRSGVAISQWVRWKHGKLKTSPRLDKVIALNFAIQVAESQNAPRN